MKYRNTTVLAEKALGASGTEIIPLNLRDVISRLTIGYRLLLNTALQSAHPVANITRIELVDGSDVLFGMDGYECQGLNIYDRRVPSMMHGETMGGNHAFATFAIDFGRFLHDTELALDPAKFDNLALKISYDRDACGADDTVHYAAVYADVFDEKPVSPVGFLMSKEHWQANLAQNAFEYVKLPTDYPVRQLLVRAFATDYEPWYTCVEARLDEDNLKRIPFDWEIENYHRIMKGVWLPVDEGFCEYGDPGTAYKRYATPTDYHAVMLASPSVVGEYFNTQVKPRGGMFYVSGAAMGVMTGRAWGWLPHHCIQFPFGDPKDVDDWYDVTAKGSVRLRLKGSAEATPGVASVVLQQLRRY